MTDNEQDAESDAAANLLEAAFFGLSLDEGVDQASVDLSSDLPLIEGYKLVRLLGEGGFGMVYEAEQRVPIRRRVALKVLRPGCTTRELLARFEQERQALALMNHPHIARIYDAGETEDGRPFIAMEMVDGSTIDKRTQSLSLREKITLMLEVCRAVAHAHHKGIIHRDLKPSNILITDTAGKLEPRVIDFGIAKALDGPLVTKVMFTQIRQVVGTPGYMSPERQHTSQISHSADTRTDVFALGAILWELLSGRTPVQSPDGGSTRVTLPNVHGIPEELRWITEKATDPDMERRYANADGLADDLQAWLEDMPLKAAPRSTLYVISKWAARNRASAVVGSLLLVTLVVSLLLLAQKNQQVVQALHQAELNQAETLCRTANESYLMGMTRERRRPVLGLAHWAHALRQDPANQAALGMALSTLRHRSFARPVAPVVSIPNGRVARTALSADGQWACVVLQIANGEVVLRARRGGTLAEVHPIPADRPMTQLAISNAGIAAVSAARGAVGLLQRDGSWKASERDVEGLRLLAWTPQEQLWCVGVTRVARLDSEGKDAMAAHDLSSREERSAASLSGQHLAVGIGEGHVLLFNSATTLPPRVIVSPIPAPLSALAVDAGADQIAAAWRSGEVWLHKENGSTSCYRAMDSILHLHFMSGGEGLLLHQPHTLTLWNPSTGGTGSSLSLKDPLVTALPAGRRCVLMQSTLGRPVLQDLGEKSAAAEVPGIEGRVVCQTGLDGRLVLIVDEDHACMEWLTTQDTQEAAAVPPVEQAWLALTPSAASDHWVGVAPSGQVWKVLPGGKAEALGDALVEKPRLAACDAAGRTLLLDMVDTPSVFTLHNGRRTLHRWGKPSTLALSAQGRFAALGYPAGEVRIFDVASSRALAVRDWQRGAIGALTFIGDDRVAVATANQVRVWQWRDNTVLPTPIELTGNLRFLAACREGKRLAAAGDDAALHVIDVESGRRIVGSLAAPENVSALAWAPDDQSIWVIAQDSTASRVPMPPLLAEAPAWLPDWIEHHTGVKVDDQGRIVRLRAGKLLPVPANAPSVLKEWLDPSKAQ